MDPVGIFDGMDRMVLLLLCGCLSVRSLNSTLSLCIFSVVHNYILCPSPRQSVFGTHEKLDSTKNNGHNASLKQTLHFGGRLPMDIDFYTEKICSFFPSFMDSGAQTQSRIWCTNRFWRFRMYWNMMLVMYKCTVPIS